MYKVGLAGLLLLSLLLSFQALASTRIAAAASLQLALKEIAVQFNQAFPQYDISLTFGSSGVITSQVQQGAPFELFFSADVAHIDQLQSLGLVQGQPYDYALGRIAFYSRQTLSADAADSALKQWLEKRSPNAKLAIANPRHAPFGVAAMAWLSHIHPVEQASSFLVQGENVAQAVQFVLSGAAETGVVAWSLLKGREDLQGQTWLIPATEHPPLIQRVALIKGAGETAQVFFDYIQQPEAKQILTRHGFGLPD